MPPISRHFSATRRRTLSLLGLTALPLLPARAATPSRRGAPVFVLNSLDGDVSVIDSISWTEIKRIPTGREPHHLYLTPDEKSVIVANAGSDSLTFIDPRTAEVQRTLRGIRDPYHLRFSPDMKWFVTAANRLNHIDIYSWDGSNPTLAKRIPTGKTPSHLWIDTQSTTAWSSMQDSDELVVVDLDTQQFTHRVKTGPMPADVFVTPDDKHLLLGLTGGDGVEVYDVAGGKAPELVKKIATGEGAHAFRAAGDGRHVFVSNRVANTISKIDYVDFKAVEQSLAAEPGVTGVHDLHIWSLTSGKHSLSSHIVFDRDVVEAGQMLAALRRMLSERFDMHHVTLQLEHMPCEDAHSAHTYRPPMSAVRESTTGSTGHERDA